jgi:nucleotide-binding universal stress UspA family protein
VVVCRPRGSRSAQGFVVGADGTPDSVPVIEFAYEQASLHRAPLTVVHAFWDAAVAVAQHHRAEGREVADPDLEDLRALLATSVAGMAERYPDVKVDLALRHGFVEEALAPRGAPWELVVVGRHGGHSLARLLQSSVSRVVVERAAGNVAVVPEGPPR